MTAASKVHTGAKNQVLNLFFPQWQGSGNTGLHKGAHQLYEQLSPTASFLHVPVSLTYSLTACNNILGYSQISAQLSEACRAIAHHNPTKIFTLGGDCGVEIAPVSYLNQKYGSSLAVIWLDAHGDLNTPDSSPSAHFHGMPLRSLLGEGDHNIITQAFSNAKSRAGISGRHPRTRPTRRPLYPAKLFAYALSKSS